MDNFFSFNNLDAIKAKNFQTEEFMENSINNR